MLHKKISHLLVTFYCYGAWKIQCAIRSIASNMYSPFENDENEWLKNEKHHQDEAHFTHLQYVYNIRKCLKLFCFWMKGLNQLHIITLNMCMRVFYTRWNEHNTQSIQSQSIFLYWKLHKRKKTHTHTKQSFKDKRKLFTWIHDFVIVARNMWCFVSQLKHSHFRYRNIE